MSGTILRGEDGSLYFIRDEILNACKAEGEHLKHVQDFLASEQDQEREVEGFSFHLAAPQESKLNSIEAVGYARGSLLTGNAAAPKQAGDTIMCPW